MFLFLVAFASAQKTLGSELVVAEDVENPELYLNFNYGTVSYWKGRVTTKIMLGDGKIKRKDYMIEDQIEEGVFLLHDSSVIYMSSKEDYIKIFDKEGVIISFYNLSVVE